VAKEGGGYKAKGQSKREPDQRGCELGVGIRVRANQERFPRTVKGGGKKPISKSAYREALQKTTRGNESCKRRNIVMLLVRLDVRGERAYQRVRNEYGRGKEPHKKEYGRGGGGT